jgi:hypothetical protein
LIKPTGKFLLRFHKNGVVGDRQRNSQAARLESLGTPALFFFQS